ncbi:uncharacterized protein LOC134675723 [Cydia fagiglandana]|uniref:uncharacterized protein LOC134675723 n=1 Tax=Cydia fagiglandana TaxID=1458189 RepID=UPI002FEDF0DA
MAKTVRNVTLPPTETNNPHRRSRHRIYGRRQNVAQEPPERARIPWSPPKSQSVLGPHPGMASYYSKNSLEAANVPPTPEELENVSMANRDHLRPLMDHRDLDLTDLALSRHMDHLDHIMDPNHLSRERNVDHMVGLMDLMV